MGEYLVDGGSPGVGEAEAGAEEVGELQGEPVLHYLMVVQHFGRLELIPLRPLLPHCPLQQVRLRVQQAAHVVLLDGLLALLAENGLEGLVDDGGLFEVLEAPHCALQDDEAELEDVEGAFGLEVGGLGDGALHEVLLGHVHLKNAS